MKTPKPQDEPRGVPIEIHPRFDRLVGSVGETLFDVSAYRDVRAIPAGGRITVTLEETEDLKDWGAGRPAPKRATKRRTRRPRRRRPAR